MSNELYHYGIKNQQWGVRRYQYEDGTLTPEGKARYRKLADNPKELKKRAKFEKDFVKSLNSTDKGLQKRSEKLQLKVEKYKIKGNKEKEAKYREKLKNTKLSQKDLDKYIDWGRDTIAKMDMKDITEARVAAGKKRAANMLFMTFVMGGAVGGAFVGATSVDVRQIGKNTTIGVDRSHGLGANAYLAKKYEETYFPKQKKEKKK